MDSKYLMYKVSRYWNRLVYKLVDLARLLVDLARFLVWDYTKSNADILGDDFSMKHTREIMTYIPREHD